MSNNKQDSGVRYIGKRHPDWPIDEKKFFSEQQNKLANKIVDTNYNKNKHKTPFTQVAENAVKHLGFTYDAASRTYTNDDGQTVSENEAREINKGLNKNFQDQKQDDYLALLKRNNIQESKIKHPGYPRPAPKTKLANMPIINRNINNSKNIAAKTNPTIERYKQFKEEKKFNEDFEKEYGDKAIEKYVRSKVYENKKAGKADYEDLPSHYLIVGEHAKDKAKERLDLYKKNPVQLPLPYIEMPVVSKAPSLPDFKTFIKSVAPVRDPDLDAGIAGLEEIKEFKKTADLADQKFPKKARGIGPFLTGEDD